jgi:hypothetical protein
MKTHLTLALICGLAFAGRAMDESTLWTTLDAAPKIAVQIALEHLRQFPADVPSEEDDWTEATLASKVFKVHDLAYREGREPAYLEFKVVSRDSSHDLGHILVSLHEGDAPMVAFSTKGLTPSEELLAEARSGAAAKLLRYGPAFRVVEDSSGALLAKQGTPPFKLPTNAPELLERRFSGHLNSDSDRTRSNNTSGLKWETQAYRDYKELKTDYVSNSVYRILRERRANAVRVHWDILQGREVVAPPRITVRLDETVNVLTDREITRFFVDDDEPSLFVRVANNPAGAATRGLQITGLKPGSAFLFVKSQYGNEKFWLEVPAVGGSSASAKSVQTIQSFTPGWQPASKWFAGSYADQSRYWQVEDDAWCPKVGCGPVAWAMILSWWDRKGAPSAFASVCDSDAPLILDNAVDSVGYQKVMAMYHSLHDICNVICFGEFSDQGASLPGDMVDALESQTFNERYMLQRLGISYGWAWDLVDPDWNEPSSLCRKAIKDHRPAVIGLGWLWHYALAYGYLKRDFKVSPDTDPVMTERLFKCNEGWGKDHGAWYSGYDTFLGTDLALWQQSNHRYVDNSAMCPSQNGKKDCFFPALEGPCYTVNQALGMACPADRLHVRAGSYNETLTFNMPMTVQSYDGSAVIGK